MRIGFFSTMGGLPWGGSEELWCRAATVLLGQGHEVHFNCRRWHPTPEPLERLIAAGAKPHFRPRLRLGRSLRRTLERLRLIRFKFVRWLERTRPDLVLISFSCHMDDPHIALACHLRGIRYAVLLQAASPANWIPAKSVDEFRAAYANAERCYFVSRENCDLIETNLALNLPHAEIVDNPFNVRADAAPAWPSTETAWKLACVARIHFVSKSQDVLLRVMRQPKWRARPLQVVLWGNDNGDLRQVERLIDLYGIRDKVSYGGFATDIEELWSHHHGLLLPSRSEGNALSLIEAMLCGRVPITTNVGRAAELIDDNHSGFIAPAATVELVDDTLERAWQRRDDWQAMGRRAATTIRQRHSLQPPEDFANRLLDLASSARPTRKLAA